MVNTLEKYTEICYTKNGVRKISLQSALFTWKGRQLIGATKGGNTYSFAYNDNGDRTSKTVNGVKTTYYLNGSMIVAEETNGNVTVYLYDSIGTPIGIQYHASSYADGVWDVYWFENNMQGDVVAVYNESGTKLVSYKYDAWGNFTTTYHNGGASTKAADNPFTYRGYYYDKDLELYYLGTRYYDASICRFINADTTDILTATPYALTDKNLYAYCDNNPVMRADYGGDFWHIAIGAVVGAVIGATISGFSSYIEKGEIDWVSVGISAVTGAASGALAATGVGAVGMIVGNAVISMAGNATSQVIDNNGFDNFDVGDMLIDGTFGGIAGAIGGSGNGSKHLNKLGLQTVRRTFNATKYQGFKGGLREAGKAFAYYGKNTRKYYKTFASGLFKDFVTSVGLEFTDYQIDSWFGR